MKNRVIYVMLPVLLLWGCARSVQDNVPVTSIQLPKETLPKQTINVAVMVSLTGNIYINALACNKETFLEELKKKGEPERVNVIVSADGAMAYEQVLSVLRKIKDAGYDRISLALKTE